VSKIEDRQPEDVRKLKRWDKFVEHNNELPTKRLYKYDTSELGCFRIKFSNSGRYLAAACTISQKPSKTVIKIFDIEMTEKSEEQIVLKGHHDLIHDLHWSYDDNFLLSASADGSAKIWKLFYKKTEQVDKDLSEHDRTYFVTKLVHSSYVYSAKFFPDVSEDKDSKLICATACFDSKVRIWVVNVGLNGDYLNH
jgi:jouberin